MAEIKYNEAQIEELKNNKYVKSCTNKNINFTLEFKLEVVKLSKKWMFYKEIFEKLWFPDYVVNSNIPQYCYHRWKNKIIKWNIEDKKWRPKVNKMDFDNMTKDEELEYLRTKLAFYEEMEKYLKSWSSKKNTLWKNT